MTVAKSVYSGRFGCSGPEFRRDQHEQVKSQTLHDKHDRCRRCSLQRGSQAGPGRQLECRLSRPRQREDELRGRSGQHRRRQPGRSHPIREGPGDPGDVGALGAGPGVQGKGRGGCGSAEGHPGTARAGGPRVSLDDGLDSERGPGGRRRGRGAVRGSPAELPGDGRGASGPAVGLRAGAQGRAVGPAGRLLPQAHEGARAQRSPIRQPQRWSSSSPTRR